MRRSSRLGLRPLADIAEAGLLCFSRRGFRLTQMSDIGAELEMSPSAAYRYVDSKEALFHVSALHAAGVALDTLALPVMVTDLDDTVASIEDVVADWPRWPVLRAALARPAAAELDAEAEAVATELHDFLAERWRLIVLLDRTAQDIPRLRAAFTDGYRAAYLADMVAWFVRRGGEEAMARAGIEAISWLAMRRRSDPAAETLIDDAARLAASRCLAALLRDALRSPPNP